MEGLSPDKLVKVYLKIKESRDALKKKFDEDVAKFDEQLKTCLLYTSPSPRDGLLSRMPSSA